MQPHAEHQQDHTELGEFERGRLVADDAGRVRPEHDAGREIADDRRQPDQRRDRAADQRVEKAETDRCDQGMGGIHDATLCRSRRAGATAASCR